MDTKKKVIIKICIVAALATILLAGVVCILNKTQQKSQTPPSQKLVPAEESTGTLYNDLIKVTSPMLNAELPETFTVTGEARGGWYFEASFPVFLTDWDGKIIAQGVAKAQGDWMTANFVPFTATLTYSSNDISGQYSKRGTLILQKDNPSGLPEHDDAFEMPVTLR